jgi:hypothetical protein
MILEGMRMPEPCSMPHMSSSDEVRRIVDVYCSRERHPELHKIKLHGPFVYADLQNWEAAKRPGCYAIYGEDGTLRYIGISLTNVGERIVSDFSPSSQKSDFWARGPKATYIELIEVVNPWEAPSLEQFLVSHTEEVWQKPPRP